MIEKTIKRIHLAGQPPLLREIFNLLQKAGARHYALFGGAARDADYAARKNRAPAINDYDLRVWLDQGNFEIATKDFIETLGAISRKAIREEPSAGTGRILYRLNYMGADLDISIRPANLSDPDLRRESVAKERAGDSDIGLCSVAVDPLSRAWATKEYVADQANDTLTVYPNENIERRQAYAKRMKAKFPANKLIWL